MPYQYSNLDKSNIKWLRHDDTCATLCQMRMTNGTMRSLNPFELKFEYPITAIAGENGTGKSTMLAMVACAYHNRQNGYRPIGRKNSYYTFSDFFIQSRHEIPPSGIIVRYEILHNRWKVKGSGRAWQSRRKNKGGRWNDYNRRVRRNVVYLGIQRVVPHFERSTHKSYRGSFTQNKRNAKHQEQICEIAGRILGKTYDEFENHVHSKYALPMVSSRGIKYSGFNMGAGESTVLEILSALFESGRGSLLIIDEIELGLHESALIRLIDELKILCKEFHCQIICSTHSHTVLKRLPPEGRFFLEASENHTKIFHGISPQFACGHLRGEGTNELDILVEDSVAEKILTLGLQQELRSRVRINSIGSFNAVIRVLSARYLEGKDDVLCVLDGDQRTRHKYLKRQFKKNIEFNFRESKKESISWVDSRIVYLPTQDSPEQWLVKSSLELSERDDLLSQWKISHPSIIQQALEQAEIARSHDEFHTIGKIIRLPEDQVVADIIRFVTSKNTKALEQVVTAINCLIS